MSHVRVSFLAATALLAAGPLFAQTRFGAIGDVGASGVNRASVIGSLGGSLSPGLSPSLVTAPLTPLVNATVVPALVLPKDGAVRATLEALSPDRIGRISGESSKALSGRLLGLEEGGDGAPGADFVEGRFAARAPAPVPAPSLDPSARGEVEPTREPRAPEPPRRKSGPRPTVADHYHHARLLAQNYYWYSVTHILDMWPSYRKQWGEAKAKGSANVSRPRTFFTSMRIAASSGRHYVLGPSPLEDADVIVNLREAFVKWFDAPGAVGPRELTAFDAFTARAKAYNAAHRAPSNMRKHIRDALLKASTMEPAKLTPFFDSLLLDETSRETADFQNNGEQKRILDAFKKELMATLAEEPAGAGGRVRAAILLGSFATGSAGPRSDFDVELLTDGGSDARTVGFIKRLTDHWIATGHHARNPVTVHDFPSTPTRGVIDLVHTGGFIVVSLDPELTATLQRKPGEYVPPMSRADSLRGKVNRVVQYGVILASTYIGELKTR